MNRLGLLFSLACIACGGSDDGGGAGPVDAAVMTVCNPVTQTGCDVGEKCSVETLGTNTRGEPFFRTFCGPNGDKGLGQACTAVAVGETGYDDCQAGFLCLNGECDAICTPDQGCLGTERCSLYANLFSDVGDGNTVGACSPLCDPVLKNCVRENEACYLNASSGEAACTRVPMDAVDLTQDSPCHGPSSMENSCYANGCAPGFGPLVPPPDNAGITRPRLCAAYCTPVNTYGGANPTGNDAGDPQGTICDPAGNVAGGQGVGAVPYSCRFVQTYYTDTGATPNTVGVCTSNGYVEYGGLCSTWDVEAFAAAFADDNNDGIPNDPTYCRTDPANANSPVDRSKCPVGCIDLETNNRLFGPGQMQLRVPQEVRELMTIRINSSGEMVFPTSPK